MKKRRIFMIAAILILLLCMSTVIFATDYHPYVYGSTADGVSCAGNVGASGTSAGASTSATPSQTGYPQYCSVQLAYRYLVGGGSVRVQLPVKQGSIYATSVSDSGSGSGEVITAEGNHGVITMNGYSWSGSTFWY